MCRKISCTCKIRHTTIISRHLECFRDILTATLTNVYFRSLLKWCRLFHRRASLSECSPVSTYISCENDYTTRLGATKTCLLAAGMQRAVRLELNLQVSCTQTCSNNCICNCFSLTTHSTKHLGVTSFVYLKWHNHNELSKQQKWAYELYWYDSIRCLGIKMKLV